MNNIRYQLLAAGILGVGVLMAPSTAAAQRSGVELWSQNCNRCHTAQPPIRYTANDWESIIASMKLNARLTDDEAEAILEFLKGGAKPVASARPTEKPLAVLASAGPLAIKLPATADSATNFSKYCVACHGKSGKGNGPVASALNPKPRNLVDPQFQAARTDEQLAKDIAEGKNTMPAFGKQLTPAEVQALVAYIRSMSSQKGR
ncbi:MAG: c-type cytochrome [Gemmatimonadales bacterium]